MQTIGIIPARYQSSRFPGKPLALLAGKPVLQHVYERARSAAALDEVIIATDDERIADCARAFGARVAMTSDHHLSGTDRCAEAALQLPAGSLVINVQGDEPFIDPQQIEQVVAALSGAQAAGISTLAKRIVDPQALFSPDVVKAVFAQSGAALYFSRAPIPHLRGLPREQWMETGVFFQHIGIYGFRRETLLELAGLPPGRYEQLESLEQLRWLEAGYAIQVAETSAQTIGIDTPEDLQRAEKLWAENQKANGK